ncbi:hypothetical protein LTS12_028319 [Elasticomyces elasticus]|nr:hypothetical protein LTS12_028319 [Elasticomyces elasticus]
MAPDLTNNVDKDMFAADTSAKKTNPATPQKRINQQASDTEDNDTPSKKAKTGTPSNRAGLFGPIPLSYEEAGPEDKKILQMRDSEGRGWTDICEVIEWITGVKIRTTSLRNRYNKMKSNFVVFEDKDVAVLFQSKKEIEDKFEAEKWQKIADSIEAKTGNKYPSTAVQKKYKTATKETKGFAVLVGDA